MNQRKPTRRLLCVLALLPCLSLQSCFTTGLWASDLDSDSKAGLTPVSVALDVVTFPLQLAVLDGVCGGHDGSHHHGHHHGQRGRRCR